ncbi:TatD family hydrolase, partial [Staphylococcus saprophyticus]|uniref:TatD family hydrolase n=1 Tax=Staphylococcus saprophyticus TaxID=29385 RepID=UPI0016432606
TLLLQTDPPFLSPHPYTPKTNQPLPLTLLPQQIPELPPLTYQQVSKQTTQNPQPFFKLKP